ncbi:helix-turn-helix domain-containing protein [Fibrella forsythiae]|uniref:Helix-turn-helix transcriptional regulator n=1 Tax=Fibrella forsythiae TaxID=2817061 RepID=A0ABS3JTB9_9BACT|nr:helix-turn-helix transcriptional regulator [Fibrella forsythiae]MBO0953259.1 helix-turn-helix transcriptional regulator [Fibrella forsythiae]
MPEQDIKQHVGQLIREARKAKGLTQKDLSKELGVSETAVNRYESGQNFTIETLFKIAKVIGVSVESLVKGV